MSYLNSLKVAVINQDFDKLKKLIETPPTFENINEAKEILRFYDEAKKLLQKEKNKLAYEMKKIKDLKKFNQEEQKESINFKI